MEVFLPKDLAALYEVLSNPLLAPIWLSMILEQVPFIQDPKTANWKKIAVCIVVGLVWALVVAVGNPGGFTFGAEGVYAIVRAGLSVAFLMNVWNKAVSDGLPWLQTFLATLFGKRIAAG